MSFKSDNCVESSDGQKVAEANSTLVDTLKGAFLSVWEVISFITVSWVTATIRSILPYCWLQHKSVQGQKILITGSGNGLGRLLALRFAKNNTELILWDIDEKSLESTAEECKRLGALKVIVRQVDVASKEAIYDAAKQLNNNIDILINNAAILYGKNFLDIEDKKLDKIIDVNVKSQFWTVKAFLPAMLKRNFGHIVSICSVGSVSGYPKLVDYCTTKYAILGFMEALQNEMVIQKKDGIHFTYALPMFFSTAMIANFKLATSPLVNVFEPDYIADQIVHAILTNQKLLIIPKLFYGLPILKSLLPTKLFQALVLWRIVH